VVERELLAECIARPDDDQPRLVWADAVGGERGELVVLQCTPRDGLLPAELAALNLRERELLSRADEWAQLDGLVHRARFRRGFVDAIDATADALLEHGDEIVRRAPLVTAVTLRDVGSVERLQRVLEQPWCANVRALALNAPAYAVSVPALFWSGALAPLEALAISLDGDALWRLVAASPARLRRLQLHLRGNPGAMRELASAAPDLRSLAVSVSRGDDPVDVLAGFGALVELSIDARGDWLQFVRPLAARLERLAVRTRSGPHPDPRGLEQLVKLRALELDAFAFGDALGRLAHHAPPSLRELRLSSRDAPAVERIARALGPRLELLDLRDSIRIDPSIRCAGETLVDEPLVRDLFRAEPARRAEWHVSPAYAGPPGAPGWLVGESGLDAGRIWDLAENDTAHIGRSQSEVQVRNPTLGRRQARVEWRDGRHWIRDLGSMYGTRVDGVEAVDGIALTDGARLELGTLLMRYFSDGARASEAARAAMRVDARTGLAIAVASEVDAIIYIREPLHPELVAAELARRLVAAAGPGVAVTWIRSDQGPLGAFGITPAARAAELVAACRGNIATATGESVEARLQLEIRR
jgi:FHA domain